MSNKSKVRIAESNHVQQGFVYNGLHFTPTNRSFRNMSFVEITNHCERVFDKRFYHHECEKDGVVYGNYDYNDFYKQARKAGCGEADTFICAELNAEFCPSSNYLFKYVERQPRRG